jgi:ABC-2 type transport system permease protein
MRERLENIYRLGVKELFSLRHDAVMVFLIVYAFTYAIYAPARQASTEVRNAAVARQASTEVRNAAVAIVDEDDSPLSRRIYDALLPPRFLPPVPLTVQKIDAAMDTGRYTFVLDIPPDFQTDVMRGRRPALQLNVDATAMTQAGTGAVYIQNIIAQEITAFLEEPVAPATSPVALVIRAQFNPNLEVSPFMGVVQLVNSITLLAMFLAGAALIREREHGTIEHLLVMPLTPTEIMLAKIWANGLVIVVATTLSLRFVVQWGLGLAIAGSMALFVAGVVVYLFAIASLSIFLATLARSMPQFALLAFPLFIIMNLLSGGNTPLDSMPQFLQIIMQGSPSTHFVSVAQAILYRGAGFDIVWREFAATAAIGTVCFVGALLRFRKALTALQT